MSWGETLFLSKIIKSQRTYAASDAVLAVLSSKLKSFFEEDKIVIIPNLQFIPKKNGSVRIIADIIPDGTGGRFEHWHGGYFHILEDGVAIANSDYIAQKYDYTQGGFVYRNKGINTLDIPVKKKSVYTFGVSVYDEYGKLNIVSLKIGAQIVDTSMIEYTTD